jgi:hypothetical protein
MIRRPIYLFLGILFLWKCAPQEKKDIKEGDTHDSNSLDVISKDDSVINRKPIDTIIVSDGNLYLAVFQYTDYYSTDLKEFEVREAKSNKVIFKPVTKNFSKDIIYRDGGVDWITITPIYKIASINPLKIELKLNFDGDYTIEIFEHLIGKVVYDSSYLRQHQRRMHFDFSYYDFTYSYKWIVESSLRFTPKKCEKSSEVILNEFDSVKILPNNLDKINIIEPAFNCFLNNKNPQFKMEYFRSTISLPTQYSDLFGDDIYGYYPFIEYLEPFIYNINP